MSAPTIADHISLLSRAAGAPYADRFAMVLGSALGPERITGILAQADQGYLWALADLLEECRQRDGHLHGDLQRREMRVAGAQWELRPPEASGARGAEIARWCTERLGEIRATTDLGRTFPGVLADLMGAVYHGRAGHEIVWRYDDRPDGGMWFVPDRAEFIHPRRWAYATNWRLHLWDAWGTGESAVTPVNVDSPFGRYPGVDIRTVIAEHPGKFLVHTPRIMGAYPTREGLGRLLVWFSAFKRFDARDWLALVAWAGRGFRIGSFARGDGDIGENPASDDDKVELQKAAMTMSAQVAAIIPDTTKLSVERPPSEGEMHDRFAGWCNDEMSKAIHGSTLGSSAPRAGGSRAQGEVHERGEVTLAKADAAALADTIAQQLLRPMVAYNFGADAPVPSIFFDVVGGEDLATLAERMRTWRDMGGPIGQRSGANALAIPNIEPGEPVLGAQATSGVTITG